MANDLDNSPLNPANDTGYTDEEILDLMDAEGEWIYESDKNDN